MYQKFIINQNGVLKFGNVYLHRELLNRGERCPFGGGLWKVIVLYGRSFDFGRPDFDFLKGVDWSFLGGKEHPLLFLPHWPDESIVEPVLINGIY